MKNKKFAQYQRDKENPRKYGIRNRYRRERDYLFERFMKDGPTRRQFTKFMRGYVPIADTFWLMMNHKI